MQSSRQRMMVFALIALATAACAGDSGAGGDAAPVSSSTVSIIPSPSPTLTVDGAAAERALEEAWAAWWDANAETWFTMGDAIFAATASDLEAQLAVAFEAWSDLDPMPDPDAQALLDVIRAGLRDVRDFAGADVDAALTVLETVRVTVDALVPLMQTPGT